MARRLVPGIAAAIAVTLATSGCGSTSATLDPVAQAADATSQAGGAHMTLTAQITAPGLPSAVTLSGQGFFNYKSQEGTIALDIGGLPAGSAAGRPGGALHMEELFRSSSLYIGSPLFAGKLPGGAHWMKLDIARVGQALGLNLQSLTGGQTNPAQLLEYLKASGGRVTTVGHELVRGVPTAHYRGAIDLSRVANVLPGSGRSQLRAALAKVIAQLGTSSLPVDVWVDSARRVRRMALVLSASVGGQSLGMHMSIELFGFGPTPPVAAPAAGDVYDATSSALAGLGAGGG